MSHTSNAQAHQSKLYYEFAHVYDTIFTHVFYPRIQSVVRSLHIPTDSRVLEVGVGTGFSLGAYPDHSRVTGVDLAPDMLEHAQAKIDQYGWKHIDVMEMDALNMSFPANTFDYTMAFHIVSVVPDATRLMQEITRVTKPGGTIVIINHFRSTNPLLARLDHAIEPITRKLGWHTLDREDVLQDVPIDIRHAYKTSRRSLFSIVIGKNTKDSAGQHTAG